jgi:Ca-activated chloride channel family protein
MMFHRPELKPMMALAFLALGLVLLGACGSPAEKLNQDGNEAFAKQAFDDALQAYESAKIESPELAEPYYNAANALYRQEKYSEALEELQKALAYTEDRTLAESSFYNMGNSSFNTQEWEAAIDAYKEALLLNPDDGDAKHNLEVALQQQQQQQEQENQDQQQEQPENGESQQDDQQEQDQNQQEEGNQSEEGDQEQEQDQPQDGDQPQEQSQSQESDQQQEQDQPQEGDQQEEQNQQNGQGQPQDGQPDANERPRPGQMPAPGQRMTEEQARQLLEAIAQDSDTLQERLGQFFFVPAGPPVQDW